MNPAQRTLYFTTWRDAKAAMQKLGRELADDKTERLRLHAAAELPPSSTAFNNLHLDRFLAACFAWTHAASLAHQERQINQPGTRCRHVAEAILALIAEIDPTAIDLAHRRPYIDALYKRLHPKRSKSPDYADTEEWTPVIMALIYRYDQIVRRALKIRKSRPLAHHPRKHAEWLSRVKFIRARAARETELADAGHLVEQPF